MRNIQLYASWHHHHHAINLATNKSYLNMTDDGEKPCKTEFNRCRKSLAKTR